MQPQPTVKHCLDDLTVALSNVKIARKIEALIDAKLRAHEAVRNRDRAERGRDREMEANYAER